MNKFCVEFGFDSNELAGGNGANTARLIIEEGWSGLLFDRDHQNPSINLYRVTITPENIFDVFRRHCVPRKPDYVSIDVDSVDLWLFRSMLLTGFRPRVVSVEYNANYGLDASVTVRQGTEWNGDQYYGASLAALYKVGREFGYQLADVASGMDAFFVRSDLWEEVPLELFAEFTRLSMHAVPTAERVASVMMEYPCRVS